ncbi:MAG: CopD family protein [Gammaproteobacteria bacterium]|nr:CopD family protein [Gammaproteobacteria bacterium]
MDIIEISSWLARVMFYAATAAVIGGLFLRGLSENHTGIVEWLRCYIRWGSVTGMSSIVMSCISQLFMFGGLGLSSLSDWETLTMLLNSTLGWSWGLAFTGFLICFVGTLGKIKDSTCLQLNTSGTVVVVLSFWFTGHLVDSQWYEHLSLLVHVIAMSIWMGALLPLWKVTTITDLELMRCIMFKFGKIALFFIPVLLIAGLFMLLFLLGDLRLLFQHSYGQTMLVKLAVVVLLLGLGALNKLVLVPRLPAVDVVYRLRKSIVIETVAGGCVLGLTALATVIIGLER